MSIIQLYAENPRLYLNPTCRQNLLVVVRWVIPLLKLYWDVPVKKPLS